MHDKVVFDTGFSVLIDIELNRDSIKISLLTDGLSPMVTGGMQKHSYYLAKFLAKSEIYVDVYHCLPGSTKNLFSKIFTEEELQFITEKRIPFPAKGFLPFQYVRNSFRYSVDILNSYKKGEESDYIYAQGFTAWAFLRDRKRGKIKAPISVNFHGLEMFQKTDGIKGKLIQYMFRGPVKYNLEHADIVYSLGGKLTNIVSSYTDKEKVAEIPIGVDESWLKEKPSGARNEQNLTRFVFIGRYERRKGIEELNAVLSKNSEIDLRFDFIGPIPTKHQIDSPNFIYHGHIKKEDEIKTILDNCDVLVCPSLAEGMPTVILEAMARGLAVIASDVGAVSVEVDESNGWLIPPGDEAELEKAIVHACRLSDEELLQKKVNSLKRIKSDFLWSKIIKLTIDQIKEVLSLD